MNQRVPAANSDAIEMRALFSKTLEPPLKVSAGLLTWFDPVDITIGTQDEDTLSLNFATFRLLLYHAEGNMDLLCRIVRELRNTWCASELRQIDLQTGFPTKLEVQIPVLDSATDLQVLSLTPLTRDLLGRLPALPDKWRASDLQHSVVSYQADTIDALT